MRNHFFFLQSKTKFKENAIFSFFCMNMEIATTLEAIEFRIIHS